MSDLFKSEDVISLEDDKISLNFDGNIIHLNITRFTNTDIYHIQHKDYCNGCNTISNKGFFGSKNNWCSLSRKITAEMDLNPM